MRRPVDPEREPRDHDDAGPRQLVAEVGRRRKAVARRAPGPDDRDGALGERGSIPGHEQRRRPWIERPQRNGIVVVQPGHDPPARLRGSLGQAAHDDPRPFTAQACEAILWRRFRGDRCRRGHSAQRPTPRPPNHGRRTRWAKPAGPIPGTSDSAIQHSRSVARSAPVAGDGPAPTPIMPQAPSADAGAPRRGGRAPHGRCPRGPRWCGPRGRHDATVGATDPSACRAAQADRATVPQSRAQHSGRPARARHSSLPGG